jgi:hypothetical protein
VERVRWLAIMLAMPTIKPEQGGTLIFKRLKLLKTDQLKGSMSVPGVYDPEASSRLREIPYERVSSTLPAIGQVTSSSQPFNLDDAFNAFQSVHDILKVFEITYLNLKDTYCLLVCGSMNMSICDIPLRGSNRRTHSGK